MTNTISATASNPRIMTNVGGGIEPSEDAMDLDVVLTVDGVSYEGAISMERTPANPRRYMPLQGAGVDGWVSADLVKIITRLRDDAQARYESDDDATETGQDVWRTCLDALESAALEVLA